MTNTTRAIIALVFTILVWGMTPVFVRSFSLKAGPTDAMVIRMCFTALTALPLLFYSGFPRLIGAGSFSLFRSSGRPRL